ncbi:MAG TPA: DinB family protein [Candidatus Krumholzibacteria bacterium]|nr:DinB family protein [Candidatus Krumholzibacteria bacterium]
MTHDAYRLDELRHMLAHAEASAPGVSQWSVGMHVHHCALTMILIGKGLAASTPPAPPSRSSLAKTAVFTSGRIPRGRAKNNERSQPSASVPRAEMLALLEESAREIESATGLAAGTWITHPVFGPLQRDDALKFVRIHNRHHLRIVADILKSRR